MSGDVQARKRKEKKRKKDEEDSVTPPPTLGNVSENLADNITIHVYKETNTGGHWCARILFFIVLAILVGLVGVVIVEHRGSTDITTPLESSRWAFIFDGWVDDSLSLSDEEPHDKEHEEVVQLEENEEKSDENTEEKIAESEASAEEEIQEEDETLIESAEEEDETTEDEIIEDESNEKHNQIFQSKEELSQELELEDSKQEEDALDNEGDSQQDFDDNDVLEEIYSISKDKNSEEETVTYETDSEFDDIVEMPTNEDEYEKFLDIPGVNEVNDDNIDPLEEVESIEPEEYVNDVDEKAETEEIEEESTSVAMKFGVGVALVVAAHFVLVKRWNNEEQEKAGHSEEERARKPEGKEEIKLLNEMVRIKKGTDDKEVEEEKEQIRGRREEEEEEQEDEEEYVEEEEEESDEEEVEDIEEREKHENNKWYQRELKEYEKKKKSLKQKDEIEIGPEKMSGEEVSEEELEEEDDDDDDEEEDEEDEEDEEEEEDDEEIENFDDSELVAKLEAKYGKLQATQDDAEKNSEREKELRRKNLVKYKHNK